MNTITSFPVFIALVLGVALTTPLPTRAQDSTAANVATTTSPVTVELGDFDSMREVKRLRGLERRDTEQAIGRLASWLGKRAERVLAPGQTLEITLRDVDLAGDYEPGRGPDMQNVRVVKDLYEPRIELTWKLADAAGATLGEGDATLRDPAFLSAGGTLATDPLRYEKRMLAKWLNGQFPKS